MKYLLLITLILLSFNRSYSQKSIPDTAFAVRIYEEIHLDGVFNESCWLNAKKITNFTQRELNNGTAGTEKTETAVLFDSENLYIGIWCFDSNPDAITAKSWNRDFEYWTDDNFEIAFDTYLDKRNAYIFVINPNGARSDVQISDEGKAFNLDWNGIWDAETQITDKGWFAEIKIPFSTLKFPEANIQTWGVNFERNIRSKRESQFWQGWSRDWDFENISHAGTLVGLKDIVGKESIELKPFASAGFSKDSELKTKFNIGGDANYLISPTIKLNLTANTDFAQIESDRNKINLTRFSIYYPEKRDFFLEGKDAFEVNYYDAVRLFHTRNIGIQNGSEIPIIAGGRIIGKAGNTSLNLLSIQTYRKDDIPTANYSVIRVNQDIFESSSIGMIVTAKNQGNHFNYVYGGDFNYSTSKFLGDKNFFLIGSVSQSVTKDINNTDNLSYRVGFGFPNDLINYQAVMVGVQKNFKPELGFLERENHDLLYNELQIRPLVNFIPGVRRLIFKPFKIAMFYKDDTKDLETGYWELKPLGIELVTGDVAEFNMERHFEKVYTDFPIFNNVFIKSGSYWFTNYNIKLNSYEGRKINGSVQYYFGDFFNGNYENINLALNWSLMGRITLSADYNKNTIHLSEGKFATDEIGGRIKYGFSPKLFSTVFIQWNNQMEEAILNFRIHWIPVVGSDLFIVLNQTMNTFGNKITLGNTTMLTKFVWRIGI